MCPEFFSLVFLSHGPGVLGTHVVDHGGPVNCVSGFGASGSPPHIGAQLWGFIGLSRWGLPPTQTEGPLGI